MYLGLNEPENKEEQIKRNIEKTFDYEEDLEELGKKLDKKNREKLSKEECDSLYISSNPEILEDINAVKLEENQDFSTHIEKIKEEALKEEILFSSEEFDIFGGITEDKTKINTLANTKHREIKRSKFRILDINKKTENSDYVENLKQIDKYIEEALEKQEIGTKINVFYASTNVLKNQKYNILYINPQNALDTLKEEEKINLYNIKLNEKTNVIALTNSIYYENSNKTLPLRNERIR